MVHSAVGFAKMANRRRAMACTSSIGPGATNMVTGAALATINRLPVLLLPGDIFASRGPAPVLQQLERPGIAGRVGQRLLQAGLALLGSHQPPRAAHHGAAGGAARPDVPSRDRRRHALPAAGRPDRGVRLSRGVLPQAGLDASHGSGRTWRCCARRRRCCARASAADHRRRRGDLQRGDGGARAVRGGDRHRRSSRPWRARARWPFDHPQALGAVGVTGDARSEPAGARGRPGDRRRHRG